MLHKAWNSKGEMPYCFPRSSIKFQGHTVQNITDFDPNWAFPDYRPVAACKSLRFALFLSCVTLTFDGWPWKTIGHLFYVSFQSHRWIQTGVNSPETLNSGPNWRFIVLCDLEIWRMTFKNNKAPLLCYFKLCASFRSHWWIQTGVTV